MAGSNIFVVYADSKGSNVTLSPRSGVGHVQPKFNRGAVQPSLLDGSGIANGIMTANVRCAYLSASRTTCTCRSLRVAGSNCIKWQQSTLDVTSTQTNWIWATRSGSSVSSDSQEADLQVHDDNGQFTLDLTKARSGNSLNPFVDKTSTTATTAGSPPNGAAPSATTSSDNGNSNGGSASGSSSSSDSSSQATGDTPTRRNILIAHGVIMSLAWVIFFPLGALIIRAISARYTIHMHSITQIFAYVLALIGMSLGIYVALKPDNVISDYHPVIGLVVMGLATVQPILGSVHHSIYKTQGRPTWWATAHVTLGRVVITLAIINGGLGLRYAGQSTKVEIAYGVVAGLIWLGWMATAVWTEVKKARARKSVVSQESTTEKAYPG